MEQYLLYPNHDLFIFEKHIFLYPTYLLYPNPTYLDPNSNRNVGNGLGAAEGTVWGWWDRVEGH